MRPGGAAEKRRTDHFAGGAEGDRTPDLIIANDAPSPPPTGLRRIEPTSVFPWKNRVRRSQNLNDRRQKQADVGFFMPEGPDRRRPCRRLRGDRAGACWCHLGRRDRMANRLRYRPCGCQRRHSPRFEVDSNPVRGKTCIACSRPLRSHRGRWEAGYQACPCDTPPEWR